MHCNLFKHVKVRTLICISSRHIIHASTFELNFGSNISINCYKPCIEITVCSNPDKNEDMPSLKVWPLYGPKSGGTVIDIQDDDLSGELEVYMDDTLLTYTRM